ncbi:chloride channel protein [Leptolyngbya sp. FACHB-36]|uniref:chloride channel protein n=1 Tax=Leptolyngbya sp. FACHB-36 TaxID=2692808 RepID=UPI001680E41D|nr:chloride channel protein [Leptolyngbya sp. FACHB-36]MBD2020094.1 chloride channel protein [Leptolyngbya sp. FACHB-36]
MQPLALLQSLQSLLRPKRLAILEAVLIGLIAALSAVLLRQAVVLLGGWRAQESMPLPAWILLPLIGAGSGFLAGFLIERTGPEAAGSGIPQVKAALAHVPIALNLRVAVVKFLSTMLTLSGGFALGRQGPTVQIGAALAAQFSRWMPASPDHQRQLIAAGAAAGLAAGFDAPIAGVMFVIEELLQDVSSLTLGTAILASFTGGVIARVLAGPNVTLGFNPLAHETSFTLPEIPFFLLLGLLAGIFAALFNRGVLVSLKWTRRNLRLSLPFKIALAGLLSGITAAALPIVFRDSSTLQVFLTAGTASWQLTALAFVVQFCLTLLACSMETPGGLFVPSLILGAALGHLVGMAENSLLGGEPVTYALTGMGAFFGAVAKVPVTAIVIVFEMTTNFELVLPLMIASVTAYLVAERLVPGSLYTQLLALKGIQLEPDKISDGLWARLTAADVMQQNVETLTSQMTLDEAVQAFSRSHHRGFPVVENGKLVGIVTLTDLDKVAQRYLSGAAFVKDIMTPRPIVVEPNDPLSQVLYLLSRYKLSRLPVTEGRRLVGIITRSDILRVESDKLRGGSTRIGPVAEPSYVVYQTRSPATGRGRLLLPLSNPQTAPSMLKLAIAIAQERHYELECLQVMLVSRRRVPSETEVNTTRSRRLLTQAIHQAKAANVSIHTQIRVAHSIDQAILETLKDRHIDLLLMGWKGNTSTPGRIFGAVVDTVIRQAKCDVVLVKLGEEPASRLLRSPVPTPHSLERWLVPIAGGPNSQYAIKLLPALVSVSRQPEIRLCQIFPSDDSTHNTHRLEEDATFLRQRLQRSVTTLPICAKSVSDAVVDVAQRDQCDVVVVGASREGLLQQAIQGNIPEAIARHCHCTVILVRKAIT